MSSATLSGRLFGLYLLGLTAAPHAHAAVIFDNGGSPPNSWQISDTRWPQEIAADFILTPGQTKISGITWTGLYVLGNTPTADNFRVEFFADVGGAPSTQPFPFFSTAVGSPGRTPAGHINQFDIYRYSAQLAPFELAANTRYWVTIFNDTSPDPDDRWGWAGRALTFEQFAARHDDFDLWHVDSSITMDFQLTSASVPEPTTLALLGFALTSFGITRRRRISSPQNGI